MKEQEKKVVVELSNEELCDLEREVHELLQQIYNEKEKRGLNYNHPTPPVNSR